MVDLNTAHSPERTAGSNRARGLPRVPGLAAGVLGAAPGRSRGSFLELLIAGHPTPAPDWRLWGPNLKCLRPRGRRRSASESLGTLIGRTPAAASPSPGVVRVTILEAPVRRSGVRPDSGSRFALGRLTTGPRGALLVLTV